MLGLPGQYFFLLTNGFRIVLFYLGIGNLFLLAINCSKVRVIFCGLIVGGVTCG